LHLHSASFLCGDCRFDPAFGADHVIDDLDVGKNLQGGNFDVRKAPQYGRDRQVDAVRINYSCCLSINRLSTHLLFLYSWSLILYRLTNLYPSSVATA